MIITYIISEWKLNTDSLLIRLWSNNPHIIYADGNKLAHKYTIIYIQCNCDWKSFQIKDQWAS